jgi:hypothetical protein
MITNSKDDIFVLFYISCVGGGSNEGLEELAEPSIVVNSKKKI